jgi:hypothetical protein
MASNQLRLWFSAFAHLLMSTLQAEVLRGHELAAAAIGQMVWVRQVTQTNPAHSVRGPKYVVNDDRDDR